MNLPASVRQKLLNLAHERNESFQRIILQYAYERLLYRLSKSGVRDRFVLKGAMLLAAWANVPHRSTQDLDLLGYGSPEQEDLIQVFMSICVAEVEPDGIVFHADTVRTEIIMENAEYSGIRINLLATLDSAKIPLRIDIGFGDAVTPDIHEIIYPCILNFPAPHLRAYPPETVIAEKFQGIVSLGMANSRMKDYYDLWIISRYFPLEGPYIVAAIRNTFDRRKTAIPVDVPQGLSVEFARDREKQQQWRAFMNRIGWQDTVPELSEIFDRLSRFLLPPVESIRNATSFEAHWPPSGPWIIS
jgi:hypothetical protein